MANQEAPHPDTYFVPQIGTFAVLTIDPVASVEYLDDGEATAASSKLVCKDYIVLYREWGHFQSPGCISKRKALTCYAGNSSDVPERCIEASMSIPIFPQSCSVSDHPSGREPLRTTGIQFPWTDCYVTTFVFVTVRCANIRAVDPVIFDETAAAAQSVAADINGDSESIAEQVLDNDDMVAIFRGLLASEVEETLITVTFTHNILRVKEFNDARGYYDEVDKIAEIVKASEARKEAAKLAAAQNDATRYDEKTAELLHGHQAFPAQEAHPNSKRGPENSRGNSRHSGRHGTCTQSSECSFANGQRGVDVCKCPFVVYSAYLASPIIPRL
ncbi:hypothetical protein C8F01DRAFT_1370643 [Mycena amicta]|nr:hypothetical protein C8F01DRAFT_1370643 [Mycena amicta]